MIRASDTPGECSIVMEDKFTALASSVSSPPEMERKKEEGEEKTKATYQDLLDCSVKSVWPLKGKSSLIQRKETSAPRLFIN